MRLIHIMAVVPFFAILGTGSLQADPVCWDDHTDGQRHCYEYIRFPAGEEERNQ